MSETRGSILGTRVKRVEDPKFLTVGGSYIGDLDLPGAAHLTYVRSTVAHARIAALDVEAARSAPGVVAVFTAADLGDLAPAPPPMPFMNAMMTRPLLATDTVRFVGEPVAVIVSETPAQGADAVELVFVDYEPLPVVIDPELSATSTTILFPQAANNIVHEMASPDARGSLAKSLSPLTATKFTAVVARPAGGGGFFASNTSKMALPTMWPFFEQGRGPL